jgi:hypothetical protein
VVCRWPTVAWACHMGRLSVGVVGMPRGGLGRRCPSASHYAACLQALLKKSPPAKAGLASSTVVDSSPHCSTAAAADAQIAEQQQHARSPTAAKQASSTQYAAQ